MPIAETIISAGIDALSIYGLILLSSNPIGWLTLGLAGTTVIGEVGTSHGIAGIITNVQRRIERQKALLLRRNSV